MASLLARSIALFIALSSGWWYFTSPDHPVPALIGAAFFVALFTLAFFKDALWSVLLALAVAFLVHPLWGLSTGRLSSFGGGRGGRLTTIVLEQSPREFWFHFTVYLIVAFAALSYAVFLLLKRRRA